MRVHVSVECREVQLLRRPCIRKLKKRPYEGMLRPVLAEVLAKRRGSVAVGDRCSTVSRRD